MQMDGMNFLHSKTTASTTTKTIILYNYRVHSNTTKKNIVQQFVVFPDITFILILINIISIIELRYVINCFSCKDILFFFFGIWDFS